MGGGGGGPPSPLPPGAAASAPLHIRRAVELSPLTVASAPGGGGMQPLGAGEPRVRDALARAALANVAALAAGSLLPEPDFGYARIVATEAATRRQQATAAQIHGSTATADEAMPPLPPATDPQLAFSSAPGSPRLAARPVGIRGGRSLRSALKIPAVVAASGAGGGGGLSAAPATATDTSRGSSPPPSTVPSGDHAFVQQGPPPGLVAGTSRRSLQLQSQQQSAAAAPTHQGSGHFTNSSTGAYLGLGGHGGGAGDAPSAHADLNGGLRQGLGIGSLATNSVGAIADADGGAAGIGGAGGLPQDLSTAESVDVRIHCLTFNMGGVAPPPAALPESLFSGSYLSPDSAADAPDIYVVSSQESGPLTEWEAGLAAHLGRRYTRVASETLMSIHILLYAKRHLAPYIADVGAVREKRGGAEQVRTSSVATGVGNVLGNKGGVAVTFNLAGAQVLLVGAHFAAHDAYVERRNADFHRICAGLFAPPTTPSTASSSGAAAAGAAAADSPAATASPATGTTAAPSRATTNGSVAPSPSYGATSSVTSAAASDGTTSASTGGDPSVRRGTTGRRVNIFTGGPTLSRFGVRAKRSSGGGDTDLDAVPGPSRTVSVAAGKRTQSFWSGVSFATAQRTSTALLSHFDIVLWMGDLNYRIAGNPEVVKYAIDANMVEVLWANDQLHLQQKKGKVLQGFQEMPIAFAPTFKFAPGTDTYDLKRTPAWTDRVLYLVNADPLFADLKPLYYMSVPELRTSDHKPVIAGFELSISPQHAGSNRHAHSRGCSIM
ncbi:hypothetical protein GPECTOR_64g149 [Gonium pectorale]|uniref:Inositol polyphosphate-related phosphatase domain-containing protein n=1 Tax=Gonium pectorale TaxID=33097 RepID=A0A150G548_GONPE|nr:hypothetical protein GPECTOR_64g149 [Gonium pectorale]|eukprot:KXZ44655.1 hypothetical protein GPECTOR_64g149 [Gonium pectorale]